jgi:hypothetical protein
MSLQSKSNGRYLNFASIYDCPQQFHKKTMMIGLYDKHPLQGFQGTEYWFAKKPELFVHNKLIPDYNIYPHTKNGFPFQYSYYRDYHNQGLTQPKLNIIATNQKLVKMGSDYRDSETILVLLGLLMFVIVLGMN